MALHYYRYLYELQVDGQEQTSEQDQNNQQDYTDTSNLRQADPTGTDTGGSTPAPAEADTAQPAAADANQPTQDAQPAAADANQPAQDAPADDAAGGDQPTTDAGGDQTTDYTQDPGAQTPGGDPGADPGAAGGDPGAGDPVAAGGDPGGGDPNAAGGNAGGGADTGVDNDNDGGQPDDDAKAIESELFATMTPQQLNLMHSSLKRNYLELFDLTTSFITRINDMPRMEETSAVINFVSKQLNDLRTMVSDYVRDTYNTKSYTENAINYNKFLAILNGIDKVLSQIRVKES